MEPYTPEQVKKIIFELLSEIAPEIDFREVKSNASLREQIDIDSIDFLNFIAKIHQRLNVNIPESDYNQLITLENIISYLLAKLG